MEGWVELVFVRLFGFSRAVRRLPNLTPKSFAAQICSMLCPKVAALHYDTLPDASKLTWAYKKEEPVR